MTRTIFIALAALLGLAACSKSNKVEVNGGTPGAENIGDACTSKPDCGGAECVAGLCRKLCTLDSDCDAGSICLSDGTGSGCRLADESTCTQAGQGCDKNAALTCGLDKTCRMPCTTSCSRDDVSCIAGGCVGHHEADVDTLGWFTCQANAGYQGHFCAGDGPELSSCNETKPGPAKLDTCTSAGLCAQAATDNASKCSSAVCQQGALACGGTAQATLQKCKADGTGFEDYDANHECATASLCQAVIDAAKAQGGTVGACPEPACESGEGRCSDGAAQACNEGRTAFVEVATCGPSHQCSPLTKGCVTLGIDATEVTRKDYQEKFLAMNPAVTGQPSPACDANTDFTPQGGWPPTAETETLPVAWVDWCDAYAYCAAIGKRLCGSIGGTSVQKTKFDDPGTSQWMNACSAGGQLAYPYGGTAKADTCNGQNNWLANENPTAVAVGAKTGCQASVPGYAGVFDLSGNVAEWEDSCDSPPTGMNDQCRVRGGSFNDVESKMACATDRQMPRNTRSGEIGFRCCAE